MRKHTLYTIVMMLCFIYGGISILFFLMQIMGISGFSPIGGPPSFADRMDGNLSMDRFGQALNLTPDRVSQFQSRTNDYFFMVAFISLSGSFISIIAGLVIHSLMRKKERVEMTRNVIDVVTTPEEKLVLRELEDNGGQMTQAEIARRTRLSRVKIHRVVKRLESIGVVSKYSYGMTNKIKLEKSFFKE
jgi:hypothetical protein